MSLHLVPKKSATDTGRPPIFDENLSARKVVYFTPTQVKDIEKNGDFSTFVRDAAVEKLQGLTAKRQTSPEELRAVMREVLTEMYGEAVPVRLNSVRQARLEKIAQELGFKTLPEMLMDLAYRVLDHPQEAERFLFAEIERTAIREANKEDKSIDKSKAA